MRLVLAFLLIAATALRAQPEPPPIPVSALPITPAAAPVPALRWKLLPELRDTSPGNAAPVYYRAFSPEWTVQFQRNSSMFDALREATNLPAEKLRDSSPELAGKIAWIRNSPMLKEVDRAARRQYCDWDLVSRVREDGLAMQLPDTQSFRIFAVMLAARARMELADGDFPAAIHSLQSGLSLSRHISDAPTLIQSLVGSAITEVMLQQVEQWIRTPNSPNLYWALTNLPQPFVDLRKPLQGERIMVDSLFPGFHDALVQRSAAPLSSSAIAELQKKFGMLPDRGMTLIDNALLIMKKYPEARQFLESQGWPANVVESLPAIQVVLLQQVAQYDRLFDDLSKWAGLPYAESLPGILAAERRLKEELQGTGGASQSIAGVLLPAITKVVLASHRVDRHIAALRCVEAIRLYAAETGRLPASLKDLQQVPVPVNPATGAPFGYNSDGTTATLVSDSAEAIRMPWLTTKYEITIRK